MAEERRRNQGDTPARIISLSRQAAEARNLLDRAAIENQIRLMMVFVLPLGKLTRQNHAFYAIDNARWPDTEPPRTLQHAEPRGFEKQLKDGIIATASSGNDVWIVRRFSRCQVELSASAQLNLVKELNLDLPTETKQLMKDTIETARLGHTATDRTATNHIYTTPDDWRTIFRCKILFHRCPRPDTCAQRVLQLLEKAPKEGLPLTDVCEKTRLDPDRPQDAFKGKLRALFGVDRIVQVYEYGVGKGNVPLKYVKMINPH